LEQGCYSPAVDGLDVTALGEVLTALTDLADRLAAARASFLRRFDAAGAHGYGSSSAWPAAKTRLSRRDA
jgi:hypothetical protein